MNTVAVLLWKDLRRAWRNPVGWLVFLAMPLVITGLIGVVFGPKSTTNVLGRIHFALVDEDDSAVSRFLRGAINQGKGGEYLDPVVLTRAEALKRVADNKLSAMVVIPAGFTRDYLTSSNVVRLELVKNPAESISPAVLEELLGVVVTGLDVVKRHLGSDLPEWQEVFEGKADYRRVSELIEREGDKFTAARQMLWPPRVIYTNVPSAAETRASGSSDAPVGKQNHQPAKDSGRAFNIFGYLLPGLASMFLLFLADMACRDLYREREQRTLMRYSTLQPRMNAFVASKALFCLLFLMLCSVVLLGGGGLVFGIHWQHPLALVGLTAAYCVFAGGLMTLLPVVISNSNIAQAMGNVVAMLIGMAGGSTIPPEQLPAVLRNYVSPWMPNYWYTQAVRSAGFDSQGGDWTMVAFKMAAAGALLMAAAAVLLRRNLERGRAE